MIFQDAPELFKIAKIPKVDFPKPYHTDLVPGYWFSKFSFPPQFNAEDFESPAAPKKVPATPKKKPEAPKKKRPIYDRQQLVSDDWFTTSESDMITLDSSGSAPSTQQAKTSSSSKYRTRWLLTEEEKKELGPKIRDDGRSRPKRKTKKNKKKKKKKKKKKNKNMKKKKKNEDVTKDEGPMANN